MNIAIILMAGKGERAETTIPKQYIIIDGKPIYEYCLLQFYRNKNIDKIILVTDNIYYDKVKFHCKNMIINVKLLSGEKVGKKVF